VLEHPAEVALGRPVRGAGAGQLDGQDVLGAGPQLVGDLKGVGQEVTLGVPEVGAVEPDVALVEAALEHHEGPSPFGRPGGLKGAAVQDGPVARLEARGRPPVAGDREVGPVAIVEVGGGEAAA